MFAVAILIGSLVSCCDWLPSVPFSALPIVTFSLFKDFRRATGVLFGVFFLVITGEEVVMSGSVFAASDVL